ncbi:MAG: trypsin-like peptidase domain-containing protein [Acidobacteriota bacterium]
MKRLSKIQCASAFLFAPLVVAGVVCATHTNLSKVGQKKSPVSAETRVLARQAALAVGLISVRNTNEVTAPKPRGSAVIVNSNGLVATNYHVIRQDNFDRLFDELFITLSTGDFASASAKRYRLRTVSVNKIQDLALLKIVADGAGKPLASNAIFPSLPMGDSNKVKLLDDIIIIGFPEKGGTTITINAGMVEGLDNLESWIKTDARLIHGNSGGAAINSEGKLIGIPTKVLADSRKVDKDGDGFPDEVTSLGSVGFLRPANLLARMIEQLSNSDRAMAKNIPSGSGSQSTQSPPAPKPNATPKVTMRPPPSMTEPATGQSSGELIVRGTMRATNNGSPVAGARVGIVPLGASTITPENLLTWCSTDANGAFIMNKSLPAGRYTLKARALGYEPYSKDIEISASNNRFIIELRKAQ